jgi:Protein of unknown function (DUF2924).
MSNLYDKLAALATMSPAELRKAWIQLHKAEPPRFSPEMLRHAVAYVLQVRHSGKRAPQVATSTNGTRKAAAARLKPGTRLMRSWHDRTITVTVTEHGFFYDDQTYPSLSAIALKVTGVVWSGPRFFGLRDG